MINAILKFSLEHRAMVLLFTLLVSILGIWSARNLPIDAVPDITNVQVQINTNVASLAPEEIEQLVTYPIEAEMGGMERLEEVRSISKFGLSQITLVFKEGTDIYRARQLVGERLQSVAAQLPKGAVAQMSPISTGLGEIYHYLLTYKDGATKAPRDAKERLRELKAIQEYVVKPALRTVDGVAEVNTAGGYERQFVIMPNLAKLDSAGLTLSDIADAVSRNTENAGGSVVEKGAEFVSVRSISRVQNIADIANLPLKMSGLRKTPLLVKDVADIQISSGVRTGTATYNGQEAVVGTVLMLVAENSRTVSERVHEKISQIAKKLPADVEIKTLYNRTDIVDNTIKTVEKNLFEGTVLVVAVLMLLLGNFRAALIAAAAIPFAMLCALAGMYEYGVSGNLMSLGAIDFGLIVDGAVVISENVVRRIGAKQHELGRILTRNERFETVFSACKQVGVPSVFGIAIITIVYIPIFALTGTAGKTFAPMAFTVVFALVGALVASLTLIPVLCYYGFGAKIKEGDNFLIVAAKKIYSPILGFFMRFWWIAAGLSIGVFALSMIVLSKLGAEFIPQLDEGSIAAQFIRATSVGLESSIKTQTQAEREMLKKFPEIDYTFSRIGTSEVATDPMGVNISDSYILLKPESQWRKIGGHTTTKDELADMISAELSETFPEQSYLFSQPIELRFNELLSGTRADLAVKIFGDDFSVLEKIGGEVKEIAEKIRGAADVEFDAVGKSPIFQVRLDRNALARQNVRADSVNDAVEIAFAGKQCGEIADGNRRFPIVVRLCDSDRSDFSTVENFSLRTEDGDIIPLGKVAKSEVADGVNMIVRESFQRRIAIQINLRGRDVQSFIEELQTKIAENIKLPEGYFIEYGGAFKNLEMAKSRLKVVVPAALALIFILVYAAFGNFRQVLMIYSAIPMAASGGIFALYLRGLPFSISAAVGFIALSGVAVLNGLMIISFINHLREEGKPLREAVREGAITRLRPVLMTALVASLGFIPMAVSTGAGAEVQRPIATVVIGGIITTTFLTLILLPSLYYKFSTNIKSKGNLCQRK